MQRQFKSALDRQKKDSIKTAAERFCGPVPSLNRGGKNTRLVVYTVQTQAVYYWLHNGTVELSYITIQSVDVNEYPEHQDVSKVTIKV